MCYERYGKPNIIRGIKVDRIQQFRTTFKLENLFNKQCPDQIYIEAQFKW